jgi:dTDP-6-deoxy-L-talose 4-dehydrogenase (NAD+)
LNGTVNLARAAIQAGVKRFVGIGTCFEYDVSEGYLKTTTPISPSTIYGACKASAFMTVSQMMAHEQKSFSWCRLFYLYGEGENEQRLVPYIRTCLSKGEKVNLTHGDQVRDYMDVSEAGRQIANTALIGLEGPINICSGSPITVAKFAYQIADSYNRPDLILLGAKADNPRDPACVFGEPNRKISEI